MKVKSEKKLDSCSHYKCERKIMYIHIFQMTSKHFTHTIYTQWVISGILVMDRLKTIFNISVNSVKPVHTGVMNYQNNEQLSYKNQYTQFSFNP